MLLALIVESTEQLTSPISGTHATCAHIGKRLKCIGSHVIDTNDLSQPLHSSGPMAVDQHTNGLMCLPCYNHSFAKAELLCRLNFLPLTPSHHAPDECRCNPAQGWSSGLRKLWPALIVAAQG